MVTSALVDIDPLSLRHREQSILCRVSLAFDMRAIQRRPICTTCFRDPTITQQYSPLTYHQREQWHSLMPTRWFTSTNATSAASQSPASGNALKKGYTPRSSYSEVPSSGRWNSKPTTNSARGDKPSAVTKTSQSKAEAALHVTYAESADYQRALERESARAELGSSIFFGAREEKRSYGSYQRSEYRQSSTDIP